LEKVILKSMKCWAGGVAQALVQGPASVKPSSNPSSVKKKKKDKLWIADIQQLEIGKLTKSY
jgi:hypothetical protein